MTDSAVHFVSRDESRVLFDANPVPMWIFDRETLAFLAANDAAVAHYGYSREEFLSMTLRDLHPKEALPALDEMVARLPAGYVETGAWRHRKRDGTLIEVEVTSRPLTFRGRPARMVLANDVTRRRRAERVLRWQAALLDVAHDAILVRDLEDRVLFWNRGAEARYGWSRAEALGRETHSLLATRFPVPLEEIRRELLHAGRWEGEIGHTTRTGAEIIVHSRWVLQREGDEWGPVVLEINSDVTGRKRAEEALRTLNAELEERVRERTLALEVSNRELEAFAYSVSHDLRAPLRALDGFSQAVLEDYGERLDETGRDFLQRIRGASQQMGQLIDDLLGLSRHSRGEMRREPVELGALAREVAETLRAGEPGHRVELVVEEGLVAEGDPRLLRVVLQNLLANAWKFTRGRAGARVEVGRTGWEGEPAFYVRDNGAGFDMAYAHKLFRPFQRLHSTREFEGSGIGLATVQRIVHRHGGRVGAQAAPDRGATVFFTLPQR